VGIWGQDPYGLYVLDIPCHEVEAYGTVYRREGASWRATGLRHEAGTFTAIRGDEWGTVYVIRRGGVYRLVGDSVVAYNDLPPTRSSDAWVRGHTLMVVGTNGNAGVVITGSF
jgi:hypothetical protein